LVNASKVWLLSIVDINLSISGKKAPFSCTKLTMRNCRSEIRLCAGAPRAWQGSCRIW